LQTLLFVVRENVCKYLTQTAPFNVVKGSRWVMGDGELLVSKGNRGGFLEPLSWHPQERHTFTVMGNTTVG
jgi:hypothetical protein